MTSDLPNWMKELAKEENNEEFSMLCHQYFKLASMRIMQNIREKFQVPPDEIITLMMAIFARLLNESVYAVGARIKCGMKLQDIFDKNQLLFLFKVLNGEPLDPLTRLDIDVDIERSKAKFREFITNKASDFYI